MRSGAPAPTEKAHSRILGTPNNMLCAFCCLIRHITAVYSILGESIEQTAKRANRGNYNDFRV